MESWKAFDRNPVSHSVAHHLTAIAELLEEYGYARVSDVARRLSITRGSVSITLKGLRQRGLVTEDDRRHLGLSEEGAGIARSVQAKKAVMRRLLVDLLGVSEDQAEIDTCKIEHLISGETAERATRLLRLLASGAPEAMRFLGKLERFDEACPVDTEACPCCDRECLATSAAGKPPRRAPASDRKKKGR